MTEKHALERMVYHSRYLERVVITWTTWIASPYIQYDQYVLETITLSPGLHRVDESKL